MNKLWIAFTMCLGTFVTIFILSMFQLAGGHTRAEAQLDAWGIAISAVITLLALLAVLNEGAE